MGLLSQIQCLFPCNRKAPHSWSTYQRKEWLPLETRPWLWLCCLLTRLPGVCQWSSILPTHGVVGLITSSISQHHSHLYTIMSSVFGGRWAVLSMVRGYWPLWWQLASYPEPKRHFGGSIRVGKHLFPRSNLFYWVSYHITILPILQWWKGRGAFLWASPPFVCSLMFPHAMAEASLMHC